MILRSLFPFATLFAIALADVEITTPAAGSSVTGLTLDVAWKDSGKQPPIADLANYQMFLCAGGNEDTNYVRSLEVWDGSC